MHFERHFAFQNAKKKYYFFSEKKNEKDMCAYTT